MGSNGHAQDFIPHPLLTNPHTMTLFPRYWPRPGLLSGIPSESRLFTVSSHSRILGMCHWQADTQRHPAVVLVHGLEGCADSHYMLGLTRKAWRAGFHVVRLNQRTCGGTEHLTPTLYHGGLSGDLQAVVNELSSREGLDGLWLAGYSMCGNLVLRMAGELGTGTGMLKGVMAVCPNIHPEACVTALEQRRNWLYHHYFVLSMKARIRRKERLFPGTFDVSRLPHIRTLREFDGVFTAPDGGYASAEDYYDRTGARHVFDTIQVPTLIVTAQNDPFIPYQIFDDPGLRGNPRIRLLAPAHGGHCGFLQRSYTDEDPYWCENRLIDFIREGTSSQVSRNVSPSRLTVTPDTHQPQ
jgi:predicted alpha/beta-fold hydrolase